MTQRDQNQNTLLEDMFAAARRDAPEPSDIFMQGLLETIPDPNVEQAPSIAEERRSFLGVLKYAVSEMPRQITNCLKHMSRNSSYRVQPG